MVRQRRGGRPRRRDERQGWCGDPCAAGWMMRTRAMRMLVLGAGLLAALGMLGWAVGRPKADARPSPRIASVSVTTATRRDVSLTMSALGYAQAWTSDVIAPQVGGRLTRVAFAEGQDVAAGQLLAEI